MASRLPLLQTEEEEEEEEELFDQTSLLSRNTAIKNETYIRGHRSGRKLQFARTVNLCLAFFALGLCFAIPTATLEDLQKAVAADSESIGFIYTARYSGYVFGSLIGGMLFDRYNRQFLLFLSLLATAVGVIIMPFCTELGALMTCTAVTGLTMGFLDTGGNVWCLDLWGKKSASFLQALHFCFGLGAFVAPLVAEPFLSPHILNRTDSSSVNSALDNSSVIMNVRLPHVAFPHRGLSPSSKSVRHSGFLEENEVNKLSQNLVFPTDKFSHTTNQYYNISIKDVTGSNNSISFRNHKLQKRQDSVTYSNSTKIPFETNDNLLKNITLNFSSQFIISTSTTPRFESNSQFSTFDKESDTIFTTSNYENVSQGTNELNVHIKSNNLSNSAQNSTSYTDSNTLYSSTTLKPKPRKPTYADGNQLNHRDPWRRPSLKNHELSVEKEVENKDVPSIQVPAVIPNLTQELYNMDNESSTYHSRYQQNIFDSFTPSATSSLLDEDENNSSLIVQADKDESLIIASDQLADLYSVLNNTSTVESLLYKDFLVYSSTPAIITPSFSSALPSSESSDFIRNHASVSTRNEMNELEISKYSTLDDEKNFSFETTSVFPEHISVVDGAQRKLDNISSESYSNFAYSSTQQLTVPTQVITSPITDSITENFLSSIHYSSEFSVLPSKTELFSSTAEPVALLASSLQANKSTVLDKSNFSISVSNAYDVLATLSPSHKEGNITVLKHFDIFTYLFNLMHQHRLGKFEFVYVILGIYTFVVSVVFLVFLCLNPREPRSKQEEGLDKSKQVTRLFRFSVVGLMSLFLCLYVGMEVAVGQLLETFATKQDLQLTKPRGYFLTYLFWGSFALGRGLSVGLALKFSGLKMLVINLIICLSASILLVCAADKIEIFLWVGIVILGLGMAPVFPAAISWVEHYLHITNLTAATFILGSALGEMALPLIINRFINQEPMVLMYTNVTVNVLCIATFVILWWLAVQQGEKYYQQESRGCYWLANCEDGEDGVEMDHATSKWQNNYNCHILQKKFKGRMT